MGRPLVFVVDTRVERRLVVVSALAGHTEPCAVEPRADRLLREVRTRGPALVLLGEERDGRACALARALRTDLRAGVRVVLVGDGAHARPPVWTHAEPPPDGWVPDPRDRADLEDVVRVVLGGGSRWPVVSAPTESLLSRALRRLRRASM
jgi:hypothetical protein